MFKASVQNNIYIINQIMFDINKIALIANIIINENELILIMLLTLSIMTK